MTPPASSLKAASDRLHKHGLCVLPAYRDGGSKGVALDAWKEFQGRLPTDEERHAWRSRRHDSICIVCGTVSGNIEMIDFDLGGEAFEPWCARVRAVAPGLIERLAIENTPSGGRHAVYRCQSPVAGNTKLAARRFAADGADEVTLGTKQFKPHKSPDGMWHFDVTLIETRGEGGLFLCAPSPGYELIQGDLAAPPTITADERDILLHCAWELDEAPKAPVDGPRQLIGGRRPGDDFNDRGDIRPVLLRHGWTLMKEGANELWCRPGKSRGTSATLRNGVFYVFSSNGAPFEPMRGYSRFAVVTLLEHEGNYKAAASALRRQGFGGKADAPASKNHPPGPSAVDGASSVLKLGHPDPATGRLVLSPRQTLPTAEAYVRGFHSHADGPTLIAHAAVLHEWRDGRYVPVEDGTVRSRLHPWLHGALKPLLADDGTIADLVDFDSNPTSVEAALSTIRSHVHLTAETAAPSWLRQRDDRPPPSEILPCRSHLLHVPSRTRLAATPDLFAFNALGFDFDEHAESPEQWLAFLHQLLGDDPEAFQLLQEWFGYALVADTSQQKMLMLVGPPRSGKGVIGRVLRELVGPGNVAGPTTGGLAGPFGLQPLIGKSLAIVSDARFQGRDVPVLAERLLCISGEDAISVPRKYLPDVTLKLPTRFVFLTNEVPHLADTSGALPSRFLLIRLRHSFLGDEATDLSARLLGELPGILLWSLHGLDRLRSRGRFVQPGSGQDDVGDLERLASPMKSFVADCCIIEAGLRLGVAEAFAAWRQWCSRQSLPCEDSVQEFAKQLRAVVPTLRCRKSTGDLRVYQGMGLRTGGGS